MSLILDALRKGSRSSRTAPTAEAAHADSVLATLGYGPGPKGRTSTGRTFGLVAVLFVVAAGACWLRPTTFPSEPSAPASRPSRATGPLDRPAAPQPRREAPTQVARRTVSEPIGASSAREPSLARPRAPSWRSDFGLALYYQRAGDLEQALAHYRAVLARNEMNPEAHNNLGLLYQQKGLLDESVREFQRATLINPRYARAHSNLGVTFMRQGKPDLARAEFELASSLDPRDADARVNLALVQRSS
ncbi:MAG: tetratricopeptide repeat protein, partial [Acidobacteriota bacterium]